MADSKRQKIVDAIVTRMQTILVAGGFETNLGLNVHDWQVNFQAEELDPNGALSVCDLPAEAAPTEGRSDPRETIWQMPVQIRFFFKKGTTPANVRKGIKDVQQAVRVDDRFIVSGIGTVMISRPMREGFLIPDDTFEIVGGIVEFEAQFITAKFNAEA